MSGVSAQHRQSPETGARVELRRLSAPREPLEPPALAWYEASWITPETRWEGVLVVREGGSIELRPQQEPPPSWLVDWTLQLLRTRTRSMISDPSLEWPRRITRWRAAPDER